MAFLDSQVKQTVLERSGGKCECTETEHEHGETCGNPLDAECQYVFAPNAPNRLKVICYSCYRKRKALRKKQY